MARKPMVTRTIVTTEVNAMCLDVTRGEPFNKLIVLPRAYKDNIKLLKQLQAEYDTDELKVVHIVSKKEVETLYGMTETEFINNAMKLNPETRKAIEE